MAPPRRIALRYLLAALTLPMAVRAEADRSPEIGLTGSGQILWGYRGLADPSNGKLVQFAYRDAGNGSSGRFLPQMIGPVTGRVACAAGRGLCLHVFFRDGTHWRYTPGDPPSSLFASPQRFPEMSLVPGKPVVPAAVAADQARDLLYAVVTGWEAGEIGARNALMADAQETQSAEADENRVLAKPSSPPVDRMIVRYEHGAWTVDRAAPPDAVLSGDLLQMIVGDGAIHLVYRRGPESPAWIHRWSAGPDEEWAAPVTLPLDDVPASSAAGWAGDVPVLLVAEAGEGGVAVRSLRLAGDASAFGPELTDETGQPVRFAEPVAMALWDDRLAVGTIDQKELVQVGCWSLDDGALLEPLAVVAPLGGPAAPASPLAPATRLVVEYLVLIAASAAVFLWRRDSVIHPVQLRPGQALARFSRRALAMLIDIAIVAPICGAAAYGVLSGGADGPTFGEWIIPWMHRGSPGVVWAWAVLGAVVGAYAAVFEAINQATPGKRLMGLFVVSENGERCGLGAIVVRNLVRVIEFYFPPIVLLLAVTVNRQRLGDLLARSVVVEPAEPQADSTEPADETTDTTEE